MNRYNGGKCYRTQVGHYKILPPNSYGGKNMFGKSFVFYELPGKIADRLFYKGDPDLNRSWSRLTQLILQGDS